MLKQDFGNAEKTRKHKSSNRNGRVVCSSSYENINLHLLSIGSACVNCLLPEILFKSVHMPIWLRLGKQPRKSCTFSGSVKMQRIIILPHILLYVHKYLDPQHRKHFFQLAVADKTHSSNIALFIYPYLN